MRVGVAGVGRRETTKADSYLKLAARVSAWLLLGAIIVSVISGWGITRTGVVYKASFGLIDRGLADAIHRATQVPMATVFLIHLFVNVRLVLVPRYTERARLINGLLVAAAVGLMVVVIIMEYFT